MLAITAALALPGCQAKLTGTFTVNGATFVPTACRSGQVSGFTGVDLVDASGNKLRLVSTPTGQPAVYYIVAGSMVGTPVGVCGSFAVNRTHTQINNVYNVEGQATLACASPGYQVTGSVQFANCH